MIFHSKIDLLQYFRFPNSVQHCKLSQFATSEFWVNFPELNIQYSLIFVFWISDRKLKINSIFGYWQFLKIEKKKLHWQLGKMQFLKIENRKKLIWLLGTWTVRVFFVHSIVNCIVWLKIDFYPTFHFNFISNSLIRFWVLKHKSSWKFNFQFLETNIFRQIQFSTKSLKFSLL